MPQRYSTSDRDDHLNEINVRDKTLLNTPLTNRTSWANKNQLGGRGSSLFGGFGGAGGAEESSGDEGLGGGVEGEVEGGGGGGTGGVTHSLLGDTEPVEGDDSVHDGVRGNELQEKRGKSNEGSDRGEAPMSLTSTYKAPVSIPPISLPPSNISSSAKSSWIGTTGFSGTKASRPDSTAVSAGRSSVVSTKFGGPMRVDQVGTGASALEVSGFSSPLVPRSTTSVGAGTAPSAGFAGSGVSRTNPSLGSSGRYSSPYSSGSPGLKSTSGRGFKPTEIVSLSAPPKSAANSATICEARIVDIPKPEAPTLPPGSPNPGQLGVLRISSL
ncbi:hypothetical protein FHG87_009883 [Trinorchestia longiramus]|nr:hypothetical protein FHG87_009883 [Trinorchestia longiramus]